MAMSSTQLYLLRFACVWAVGAALFFTDTPTRQMTRRGNNFIKIYYKPADRNDHRPESIYIYDQRANSRTRTTSSGHGSGQDRQGTAVLRVVVFWVRARAAYTHTPHATTCASEGTKKHRFWLLCSSFLGSLYLYTLVKPFPFLWSVSPDYAPDGHNRPKNTERATFSRPQARKSGKNGVRHLAFSI